MLTIKLDGMDQLKRQLSSLGSKLPGVIASGLNRTMSAVEETQLNLMESRLDRPTPFTLNGLLVFKATPARLESTLLVKDIQANYLRPTIFGGIVASGANPDNNIIPVMPNVRLNAYGNLSAKRSRGALDRIAGKRGKRFVGKVGGRVGVYERLPNRRLKTIVFLDPEARRDKRLPWFETASRVIQQRAQRDLTEAIQAAIRG